MENKLTREMLELIKSVLMAAKTNYESMNTDNHDLQDFLEDQIQLIGETYRVIASMIVTKK